MRTDLIQSLTATFEAHAQQTDGGVEFWLARDLQHLLGYTEWRNFTAVINKAKTACEVSGHAVDDHFVDVNKTIQMPKSAEKEVPDVMLTRYACYLIAQNGDPKKQEIVFAQTYFAIQTRRAELIEQRLSEAERISARKKLTVTEKELSQVIFEQTGGNQDFALIRSKGDQALFGRSTQAMKAQWKVPDHRWGGENAVISLVALVSVFVPRSGVVTWPKASFIVAWGRSPGRRPQQGASFGQRPYSPYRFTADIPIIHKMIMAVGQKTGCLDRLPGVLPQATMKEASGQKHQPCRWNKDGSPIIRRCAFVFNSPDHRPLADFAPTIILKAKDFAAEITIFNAREHRMTTEPAISREHITNNEAVRKTLLERGIRPETLPAAEDVKKVERRLVSEEKKSLKNPESLDC